MRRGRSVTIPPVFERPDPLAPCPPTPRCGRPAPNAPSTPTWRVSCVSCANPPATTISAVVRVLDQASREVLATGVGILRHPRQRRVRAGAGRWRQDARRALVPERQAQLRAEPAALPG